MFKKCKILVIGDLILDTYVYGCATRLSQEAPVPVVLVDKQKIALGGAANVCANLKALGAEVCACGVVGNDEFGDDIINMLQCLNISCASVIRTDTCPTIAKNRIVSNGQHIVRYDIERRFNESISDKIIPTLSKHIINFDAIIISDYFKGTISKSLMEFVHSTYSCPVFIDPKPDNKKLYHGFHCITPNMRELASMTNATNVSDTTILAKQLKEELNLDHIVITLSEKGVMLVDRNNDCHSFDAHRLAMGQVTHSKSDVTGAGDTLISTLAIAVCSGYNYVVSLQIANVAAAIVVNKLGTVTCELEELLAEINSIDDGSLILQS